MQSFQLPPAPAVPLLDGVPNPVSVAWYTFFVGLFQVVGSGISTATLPALSAALTALTAVVTALSTTVTSFQTLFAAQRLTLTVPAWLTVGGSPVGGASGVNGTLAITSTSESANTVLAAPSGSAGAMSPRVLVGADLPNPAAGTLGGVKSLAAVTHNFLTSISTAGQPVAAQPIVADLSDATAPGAFSPTDQSGAALAFTGVSVQYLRIGNIIWMYGTLTYPITVSGANAAISLPVAVPNTAYANVPGSLLVIGVAAGAIVSVQGTSTAQFDSGAGVVYTNANLSTQQIRFSLMYPVA